MLLTTIALIFMQSAFFGPMIFSIMQMLRDTVTWMATFVAGICTFVAAMWLAVSNEDGAIDQPLWKIWRYFMRLGLKVSPLTGAKPLILEDDQTIFEFSLIQLYWLVISTMLYSLLIAIYSTRMTKDAASRIPNFHRVFCKLVLAEHSKPACPAPFQALGIPAVIIGRFLGIPQPDTVQRATFSISLEESKSTPEKRWHSADYAREHPPSVLLQETLALVEKDMLKREGALTASTGKELFSTLMEKMEALALRMDRLEDGSNADEAAAEISRELRPGEHVRAYDGFVERADRILFPYGLHSNKFKQNREVLHMTILENGVVENPVKRLYLGGVFTEADRKDLVATNEKELRKMLKARKGIEGLKARNHTEAENCVTKTDVINALMGTDRETDLHERALIAFPFQQSMLEHLAGAHKLDYPNNMFVRDNRSDGTFGLIHCWPIKYNQVFKDQFTCMTTNPAKTHFSPRKAVEFMECMQRLFGPLSKDCKLLYATKTTRNDMKALVGSAEQLVDYLRVRPKLQEEFGILKMFPDGFTTRVVAKGRPDTEKQFRMIFDGEEQVIYVKQGFETMASCKPLMLFDKDCTFGKSIEVEASAQYTKWSPGETAPRHSVWRPGTKSPQYAANRGQTRSPTAKARSFMVTAPPLNA